MQASAPNAKTCMSATFCAFLIFNLKISTVGKHSIKKSIEKFGTAFPMKTLKWFMQVPLTSGIHAFRMGLHWNNETNTQPNHQANTKVARKAVPLRMNLVGKIRQ